MSRPFARGWQTLGVARAKARRRSPTPRIEPGSGIKPRPRIDEILERPYVQHLISVAKHQFAVAAGIDHVVEVARHQAAALPARDTIWEIVRAVRANPANATLPERAIYNYVLNRIYADLTGPIATEDERRHVYQPVNLPPGRPPTRRSGARETLINELRTRPDMPEWRVKDRAGTLDVWNETVSDEPDAVRRRVKRLREDAAD